MAKGVKAVMAKRVSAQFPRSYRLLRPADFDLGFRVARGAGAPPAAGRPAVWVYRRSGHWLALTAWKRDERPDQQALTQFGPLSDAPAMLAHVAELAAKPVADLAARLAAELAARPADQAAAELADAGAGLMAEPLSAGAELTLKANAAGPAQSPGVGLTGAGPSVAVAGDPSRRRLRPPADAVRVGFTVGKRNARRAVDRNQVKRVLRESARGARDDLLASAQASRVAELASFGVDVVVRLKAPWPRRITGAQRAELRLAMRAEADTLLSALRHALKGQAAAARPAETRPVIRSESVQSPLARPGKPLDP